MAVLVLTAQELAVEVVFQVQVLRVPAERLRALKVQQQPLLVRVQVLTAQVLAPVVEEEALRQIEVP